MNPQPPSSPGDPPSWGAPPATMPPPPRRAGRLVAIAAAVVLVLVGGVAAAAFYTMRGSREQLLGLVPASSDVVVTAYLDPSAGQKVNLLELAHKFPALASDRDLRREVNNALDQALSSSGLTHADVSSWLGSQVAVAVDLAPSGTSVTSILVASKDDAAAEAILEKGMAGSVGRERSSEYRGVTMHVFGSAPSYSSFAIVDHVVVISDHGLGLTRVIDTWKGSAPSLSDDRAFQATISALPRGKLGFLYVNPTAFVRGVLSTPGASAVTGAPGALGAMRGIAISLSADPDGLAFDFTIRYDPSKLDPATREQLDQPSHPNRTLAFVPAGSFVVATQEGLDASLKQLIDRAQASPGGKRIGGGLGLDDALASLTGDVSLTVGPGGGPVPVDGALVFGVKDPGPVRHTLDLLADLALKAEARGLPVSLVPGIPSSPSDVHGLESMPKVSWRTMTYRGATIRFLGGPGASLSGFQPAYAVVDGAAMIASSPGEIRTLIDVKGGRPDITTSASYTRALTRVPGTASTFYVDVRAIVARFGAGLPPTVRQNLDPIESLVAGSANSTTRSTSRLFVAIR